MSRFDLFFIVLDECDETTDFNIATHIINFHRNVNQDVVTEITQHQLQNYLRYARSLQPKLTPEAREFLVEKYRQFRQEDSAGVDKSSYRITVRQLESMIRLSEAIAKMNLVEEIKVDIVAEAAKLLRTSIVTIDQERVEFEPEQEQVSVEELGNDVDMDQADEVDMSHAQMATQPKKKMGLEAVEYSRISRMITQKILHHEESFDSKGIKTSELVEWYLEQKEDEISTEEEMAYQRKLIIQVLKRLESKDHVLLVVRDFAVLPEIGGEIVEDLDLVLTVHPNFL